MLEKSQIVLLIGMGHPRPGPEVCDFIIKRMTIGRLTSRQPLTNSHPGLSQDYQGEQWADAFGAA